jgi:hypothetical protein
VPKPYWKYVVAQWEQLRMIHRIRRLLLRFAITILLLAVFFSVLTAAYTRYEAHRATALLAEVSQLQIGDSEESALPLVTRNGGFKWSPEPLPPKEQWIEPEEYDYQQRLVSDYKYEITVSPFGNMSRPMPGSQTLHDFLGSMPPSLRAIFGLRDWGVTVEVSIRKGKLRSVSAMTLVEGCCGWLGHEWELTDLMPHSDMPHRAYLIGAANLTIPPRGGTAITNFFTPAASPEEGQIARNFNRACLTSVRGCAGLCDFAPRALEYLKQNHDADWGIIPPNCRKSDKSN